MVASNGSPNTDIASVKLTPCFNRFEAALFGSHSNSTQVESSALAAGSLADIKERARDDGILKLMPDTREVPAKPGLGYDPPDAERIQQLLDALRTGDDDEERARMKEQLSAVIFGC
jgi:hypothetical protein